MHEYIILHTTPLGVDAPAYVDCQTGSSTEAGDWNSLKEVYMCAFVFNVCISACAGCHITKSTLDYLILKHRDYTLHCW